MFDDEEQLSPRSRINRTGASTVIHKVTWPHKVVYASEGKPASYQDLSIPTPNLSRAFSSTWSLRRG